MPTIAFQPTGRITTGSAEFSLLGELLQTPITSNSDLAALTAQRVGIDVIDRLGVYSLKADELAFIVQARTLLRRGRNGERLSVDESDKAIRLARLIAQTEIAFGSRERALIWLRAQKIRFDGKTALEMAATEQGARFVEETLTQVVEGYFA